MHTIVDYSKVPEGEKLERAIADIKEYLGEERWEMLESFMAHEPDTMASLQSVNVSLAFAGITGFPVLVLLEQRFPKAYAEWTEEEK